MSNIIQTTENIYRLFNSETENGAVSDAITRTSFLSSTVYIKNTGSVPVTIEASPGFGIWVPVEEPISESEAIVHVEVNMNLLRVVRGSGGGEVTVVVVSGGLAHR